MVVPHITPQFTYPPDPKNPKLTEFRRDYLRTQLLSFQPGMRPQRLPQPEELEDAMAAFVQTDHCPRLIRDDFLKSLDGANEDEEEVQDHDHDGYPYSVTSIMIGVEGLWQKYVGCWSRSAAKFGQDPSSRSETKKREKRSKLKI